MSVSIYTFFPHHKPPRLPLVRVFVVFKLFYIYIFIVIFDRTKADRAIVRLRTGKAPRSLCAAGGIRSAARLKYGRPARIHLIESNIYIENIITIHTMDGVDEHQHQLQHCNTRRRTFWCWRRRHGRSRSSSAMDGRQIWTATMLKLIVLVTVAVLFTPSPATVNGQDLLLLRPPKGLMARLNAASMTNDNEAVAAAASSSLTECPELCSCLDSYVMCTKLNLLNVTQAGGIPKWVETL